MTMCCPSTVTIQNSFATPLNEIYSIHFYLYIPSHHFSKIIQSQSQHSLFYPQFRSSRLLL